jgi:hypothetical protein
MKLLVAVPTYNEAPNRELFLKRVFENISEEAEVIVVDDNSPDGTAKITEPGRGGQTPAKPGSSEDTAGLSRALFGTPVEPAPFDLELCKTGIQGLAAPTKYTNTLNSSRAGSGESLAHEPPVRIE